MRGWWWLAMTGDRCQRQKTMMGRGADGGCGTEELSCPTPRVPARSPANQHEFPKNSTSLYIDFFSQARKALCERSPFDVSDDSSGSASAVLTLPSNLASLLKQSDNRKRHKKSHSGVEKKSSRASERPKGLNIWAETEEYFRDLTSPDIDKLFQISSFSSLASTKCLSIPIMGKDSGVKVEFSENVNCGNSNGVVFKEEVKEEVKEEDESLMEVDSMGAETDIKPEEENGGSDSQSSSRLEWLLGCRNKIYLTSERPSKKRKLLGSDAGLDKVLNGRPCDGNSSLCHFCCTGDDGKDLNRLIVCSSCNVAVHQKCYGVQDDVGGSWLCSWCKEKKDSSNSEKPCILCPMKGGALKPVHRSAQNGGSMKFAHLFCCQWMPEVYIEDLTKLEPIMNVEGIKETRRKLVCNVCKVKCGTCVRCSHGACRTSFHPICAREARHRMEIWGKYGCNNVELRAFCSKHSDFQDRINMPRLGDFSIAVGSNSCTGNHIPVTCSANKSHKLKIGSRNGDEIAVQMEAPVANCDKSGESELQKPGLSDSKLNAELLTVCGDAHKLINVEMLERSDIEDDNPSDSLNFVLIMKTLIDRGKVNVKDVALEIGISPGSLSAALADDSLVIDLRGKIVRWLRNHAYMGILQKNLKVKIKSVVSSKAQIGAVDDSDDVAVSESDVSDPVSAKSVPPRRRTKSNIRILKDNKAMCLSEEVSNENGVLMESKVDQLVSEEPDKSSRIPAFDATLKNLTKCDGFQDSLAMIFPESEGNSANPPNCSRSERCQSEEAAILEQHTSVNAEQGDPVCSVVNPVVPDVVKAESVSSFYVQPYIHHKLLQMKSEICSSEEEMSRMEASSYASVCCNHQKQHSNCSDIICRSGGVNFEQMAKARKMGVLELSPEDEVEGEIIYFQHRLLGNAAGRKRFTDNLICKVAKSLPRDIDAARSQRWDAVLVNQYLCDLKEAKKLGRKERRHKEAQAVLAAATAAAAASSRISSFRKDAVDDSAHRENLLKLNTSSGRARLYSQLMPRAKETLSRVAFPRISSEKYSDYVQSGSDFSKEHPRSCDICRRSETILNPILVCCSCKVAVHLDCYRSVKESTGPWYCELCEDLLSSRSSGAQAGNLWEKSLFVAECGLCPGTTGAFRKSTDGQWIHGFCAEWVFESTFRRGQVNPIEGMETVSKGVDVCCICNRRHGVSIKCNHGHCQTTFHPYCARCAGFYMNVKTGGGKLQHKAYCEKHSLEQRANAETQKHGIEELKNIKQIRVELERLRLLCERIVKREKIKRELVLCSHDVLALKRDHAARSVLAPTPFFPPDVSSESATTSLKGHMDGYKSCSEAIQRSDDVTVDSTVSVNYRVRVPVSMDTDQRTDDSSASQNPFTLKPRERVPFSGKQIPHRPLASRNLVDDGGKRSKCRKRAETFEKELIMTSDQASMKNQRLPKGFVYVPAEQINQDVYSGERLERNG